MRKVKFFTLGCKVNQYETQAIREQFLSVGFGENIINKPADIYIINTCTVTHQADRESRRLIRKSLRSNPESKIIVTGCLVEKDAHQILQISDQIRIVPNHQKHLLLESLRGSESERNNPFLRLPRPFGARNDNRFARNDGSNKTFIPLKISGFKDHERAFVKIQDGCNNFCSYCKVPLVRGPSRSRSLKEIVEEVTHLVNHGFKEIVLTGICLGDYRYGDFDLVDVLIRLEKIEGRFRIRLSSIEPQLISDKLIEKVAGSAKICPHFHIPLQSGDNAILKRMNRRYTQKKYLSLIAKIKKKIKDVAITTDVLVGFPQETERNFRSTVHCLKEISPLRTHIFSFSPRQGTAAYDLQERIEPKLIKERVNLLKRIAEESSYKFRKHFLGKNLTVLIESRPDKESNSLCGYSENYIRVIVKDTGDKDINNLLPVKVKAVDIRFTKGTVCLARGGEGAPQDMDPEPLG